LKTATHTLVVNASVVYAELDDEAVLLNVETGIYFGLNTISTEIWRFLEQGASEGELVSRLADEYEVEPEQLSADIAEFLSSLLDQGLIRAVEQ